MIETIAVFIGIAVFVSIFFLWKWALAKQFKNQKEIIKAAVLLIFRIRWNRLKV